MNLAVFHFLRPWWFALLLPMALLWFKVRQNKARSNWSAVCDPHLLPHILTGQDVGNNRWLGASIICAILLTLTALAGPTWEKLPQPVFRPQSALVILLDLSRSMDCPDLSPSRLARARFKVADILKQRKEGQTALVAFAGDAFTVTPLTTDTKTIDSLLSSLKTEIMPTQGSRVDLAIEKGVELINQAGLQQGDLLLIGDGYSDRRSIVAAEKAYSSGIRLSVLAVGTKEGAPVPTKDGFLQDAQGTIVIPKLNEMQLRDLASRDGGEYRLIRVDDQDIKTFLNASEKRLRSDSNNLKTDMLADRWLDQGPWLVLALLPLAALAFRRGLLFCLLLLFFTHSPAQAFELQNLFQTDNQQAASSLQQGNAIAAAEKFSDPHWKAVAQYRAGQYQAAADGLKDLTDSTSRYNRGNALAQLGDYQQAIKMYEQVPVSDPVYSDAQYNKQLLEKLLKEQQDHQQQQKNQKQNQQDQSQKKDKPQNQPQKDSQQQQQKESDKQQQASDQTQQSASEKQQEQQSKANSPKQFEQKNNDKQQQEQNAKKETAGDEQQKKPAEVSDEQTEQKQLDSSEQWLKQIPDDPGSLLQRKFLYQYRQRQGVDEDNPW